MKYTIETHQTQYRQIYYVKFNGHYLASNNADMSDAWETDDLDSDEPEYNLFTESEIEEILANI